MLTVLNHPVW